MKKPIIGVTPLEDIQRESLWMLPGYFDGITEAGGIPIMLPMTDDAETLRQLTDMCDGFLITGGQDVQPSVYGEDMLPECDELSLARDAMEVPLVRLLVAQEKPVLGICRGIQILNAALGGTLYQDLSTQHHSDTKHTMPAPYDRTIHTVQPVPGTPLHALLGGEALGVNSLHHQAVKALAPVLKPMAYSPDGLVEAAYMPEKPFVWAVQWHPEFSFRTDENSRKIFREFVRHCI